MREHARHQTAVLLRRLAYEVNRVARAGAADAEAVHDLRVAIRRLSRCLRAFAAVYPGRSWKRVRRALRQMMDATAEVRDRDIAMGLLRDAGTANAAAPLRQLARQRGDAARHLAAELHHWRNQSLSRRWREELGL
ncbi:MAG: CHAD domain-containing protein [Acidobacteria bacterium]|nr:CHAD domain-containing protein [Acidobacteriota bacterium]